MKTAFKGALLLSCGPIAAWAQEATTVAPAVSGASATEATPASDGDMPEVVVFGRGQTRSVAEIGAIDLARLTPGTSPIKAIQKLPGVNFQSADPFGLYEWAVRISLRGYTQTQLGFTLDGIPLGDMSYGNTNGLHISRAIINDNIGLTRVSQGAGALTTASTSNLGGTIEFFSRDPARQAGFVANGTYGSNDTVRLFARAETGDLNGFRAFLSYAFTDVGKWKGVGAQRAHQANLKATYDFGEHGKLSAFVNFTDRRENDYQDLSLDIIRRLGLRNDNISNNWPLALQLARVYQNQVAQAGGKPLPFPGAGLTFPAPYQTVDDVYYDAGGLRRDWLTGARVEDKITDTVDFNVTVYYHNNRGQGSWFTPYVPGPSNPVSFRTTEYGINRYGVTAQSNWVTDRNTLTAGIWFENNDFNQARRFYDVQGTTRPSTTALTYQTNPFFTQWNYEYNTQTLQPYLQDMLKLTERLSITAGFKGQQVVLTASPVVAGNLARGRITNVDWFLPQAGVLYRLGDRNEMFFNYAENQRAFTAAATGISPFATTQNGFNAIQATLRPEKSRTFEGGVRLNKGPISGVVTAYYTEFTDRLLPTVVGAGIIGNPVVLANVGAASSKGIEAGINWRIARPLTLTASYAYNESTYDDNVQTIAGVFPTRGKTVVDSPHHIANAEIVYDQGNFYARANGNYMSRRFFTYLNDQSVGARFLLDATIGYRLRSDNRWLNGVAIEASATNLTDERYVATIGSNGYGFSGDNQTLLAGAPRQWFVTLRKGF